MRRNSSLVTICVLCLLSAAHMQCSTIASNVHETKDHSEHSSHMHGDRHSHGITNGVHPEWSEKEKLVKNIDKRHFIQQIFDEYGNGVIITVEGFEQLLETLHLSQMIEKHNSIGESGISSSTIDTPVKTSEQSQRLSDSVLSKSNVSGIDKLRHSDLTKLEQPNVIKCDNCESKDGSHEDVSLHSADNHTSSNLSQGPGKGGSDCLSATELLSVYDVNSHHANIDQDTFTRLCPALIISQIKKQNCISVSSPDRHTHMHEENIEVNTSAVWLYSTLSILGISLCGLLGVAVIPCMQKVFYQRLIQFLVALGVGSLSGDALLHLLPHAMSGPHTHEMDHFYQQGMHESSVNNDEHSVDNNVWKGFAALLGVVFFFFMEKCLTLIGEWRKRIQRNRKPPTKVRVMRDMDVMGSKTVGEKLCKHKYSSYPYCYGEIASDLITEDTHTCHEGKTGSKKIAKKLDFNGKYLGGSTPEFARIVEPEHSQCALNHPHLNSSEQMSPEEAIIKRTYHDAKENHIIETKLAENVESNDDDDGYTVIIREHENKHHGHSHAHGHVHAPPKNMSSVVWMVIMGDGLHNFTDGMAVGAAFAASIAGGFSTALAVFCHELPHELGDFAVLLKAGMTARQAIFYNLLSSVLCFFGMILGVFLGKTPSASLWIFSVAAGMFLYIALVDMIPELTSSHSKEGGSFFQLVLQFLGLFCGLGIMLVIALYEHDLKEMFQD